MGAVKQFFTDSATLGMCPVSQSTIEHLETLESSHAVDWIKYVEIPFLGYDKLIHYENGIALQSAERLIAEDMATEEIVAFVEDFGDFFDPSLSPCDRIAVVGFGLFYLASICGNQASQTCHANHPAQPIDLSAKRDDPATAGAQHRIACRARTLFFAR
jgi:hypothetical protein